MLEIACFNAPSAISAAKAGADRIELCADYAAGGVTPSHATLQAVRKAVKIPINVMIRPRCGDFCYTDDEFNQMKLEIEMLRPEASGFVFGILDENYLVDKERNAELVKLAAPLPCTFHRAFDQVHDMFEATEQLIECGFKSILTSGGQLNATGGAKLVAELHKRFGDRITYILGGGIRSGNVAFIKSLTRVEWYHSAAITEPGEAADKEEVKRLKEIDTSFLGNDIMSYDMETRDGTPSETFKSFIQDLDGGKGSQWNWEEFGQSYIADLTESSAIELAKKHDFLESVSPIQPIDETYDGNLESY